MTLAAKYATKPAEPTARRRVRLAGQSQSAQYLDGAVDVCLAGVVRTRERSLT
jgi:hypothetical protein